MNYENRVVLFLDILGFKSKVDKTINKDDSDNIENIGQLYRALRDMNRRIKSKKNSNNSKVITQFSDSIVVSFLKDDIEEIFELFKDIQDLMIYFILNDIICRGAISYGKLFHTDKILFGPALIDTYETESKAALYPRIVLDKSIVEIGVNKKYIKQLTLFDDYNQLFTDGIIEQYLKQDTDDKFYIDYFTCAILRMNEIETAKIYLDCLHQIITSGLRHKSPDIKIKYGWMKNKFNQMINFAKNAGINNLDLIVKKRELHKYLMNLEIIK